MTSFINPYSINPLLAKTLNILLIAVLAYHLSIIFWQYYSPNKSLQQSLINPSLTIAEDTEKLQSFFVNYALFGIEPVVRTYAKTIKPKRVPVSVPKISLEVKGILLSGLPLTIIETGGVQETYTIGEYISYLYISNIKATYVEFDHNGYKQKVYVTDGVTLVGSGTSGESVIINEPQSTQQPQITEALIGGKNVITPVLNHTQRAKFLQIKNSIRSNPLQVIGTMNFLPYRESGKISGFQVTPGREKELFKASGLLSGDILLSVNNQSLSTINNFTTGMDFINKLGTANELNLIIRRQGQQKRIFIKLQN